jgi:hypothetical protein
MQYNFCMCMSRVTSSYFAKYFCDIYSEYITPCAVINYTTSHAIRVTSLRLRTLCSWAIVWSDSCKRKLANHFIYSKQWMIFYIIYYPLYMLIMQVYHDSDHMRDFDRMPDSGRKIWLRSYILTPVVSPGSGRISLCIMALIDECAACLTTSIVKDFAWPG